VTKPGNSDQEDRAAEPTDTGAPADPTPAPDAEAAPATGAEIDSAPDPVADTDADTSADLKADASDPVPAADVEADADAKADAPADAKADEKAESDAEPLMTELEKAPPAPVEKPIMPTAAEAARDRAGLPRPRVLQVAFYVAIASGVIGLASGIVLIAQQQVMIDFAVSPDNPNRRPLPEAENLVSSFLWIYMIVVVALGAFLALFAYKAQDGVRRARMMSVIITLMVVGFHFYLTGTEFGLISGLSAAIAVALMYAPSTRAYFGPRQTVR
jgi:hypothetical protein